MKLWIFFSNTDTVFSIPVNKYKKQYYLTLIVGKTIAEGVS